MDHDFIGSDDVIGETRVDLENRFYSRHLASCGLALYYDTLVPTARKGARHRLYTGVGLCSVKSLPVCLPFWSDGYNKWRDAKKPSTILTELCRKNGIPSPEFRTSEVKVLNKIFKIPPDAIPEGRRRVDVSLMSKRQQNKIFEISFFRINKGWHHRDLFWRTDARLSSVCHLWRLTEVLLFSGLLKKNQRSPEDEAEIEEHSALSVLQRWGEMREFLPGAVSLVPEHVEIRSLQNQDNPGLPQVLTQNKEQQTVSSVAFNKVCVAGLPSYVGRHVSHWHPSPARCWH